ncbi:unnamed protein product, partial [Brenthis ino]
MRDGMKPCQHTISDDVIYKEVVVIGNGPSGMVTSFMLAGNIPYLKEVPESLPIDEMLKARLQNVPPGQNLLEIDLMELAEGLEGRSQNPIPLLVDTLLRPGADLGVEEDSLIEWRYDVEKQIEHIVLGKGPPGGAWHTFPGSVRSLSPGAWLCLPPHADGARGRVPARAVAAYCRRYVHACGIQRFFRCGVTVSSVRRAPRPPAPPCRAACPRNAAFLVSGYDKSASRGFTYACRRVVLAAGAGDRPNTLPAAPAAPALSARDLHAVERAVRVLAARRTRGDCDDAGRTVLVVGSGVSAADAVRLARGAGLRVRHLHRAAAAALARLAPNHYAEYCQVYKMMMDGPTGNHPDYTPYPEHAVLDITPISPHETTPSPKLRDEIDDETLTLKKVKLLNLITNETVEITVTLIAVLIGSKPDLFFLQTNFDISLNQKCIKCLEKRNENQKQWFLQHHWHYLKTVLEQSIQTCKSKYLNYELNGSETKCLPDCNKEDACDCDNPYSDGIGFGVDPDRPVDGRSNPVAIDKSTHEVLNGPAGLYAMGPLTADNFMRFIPGGAMAIVSHIHKQKDN